MNDSCLDAIRGRCLLAALFLALIGAAANLSAAPAAAAQAAVSSSPLPETAPRPDPVADPLAPAAPAPARSPPRPPDRPAPSRAEVEALIPEIARRHGVEVALVRAIVAAESNYDAHAVSRAGALGLMQLMPPTAADYGVTAPEDLFDARINLETGTRHLRRLLNKYDRDHGRTIMAYNAGEGTVDRTNSQVTWLETLNYTEAVITYYRRNGGTAPTQAALDQVRALRGLRDSGQARRLLKRYLDPSLLSLKVKPTLDVRLLDPALHEVGPRSRPMFELGTGSRP